MKKQIPKYGNKLNQLELQTGLPKGSFEFGDKHPTYPSLRYENWRAWGPTPKKRKEHINRNPEGGEYWRTAKAWIIRTKEVQANLARAKINRAHINKYKLDKGCVVCGYNKIAYCLDLDHIDPKTKTKHTKMDYLTFTTIEEINKILESNIFQILCAICHRIKTYSNKETQK